MSGTFFIISAPSGAGKTSIINSILTDLEGVGLSVSYTTRAPRAGEVEGESYHFVDQNRFDQLESEGFFLESAKVFSASYGTAKSTIDQFLEVGTDILLELDWQGAMQIKQKVPSAQWIFILPPSLSELETRLRRRQQDSDAIIKQRMGKAQDEMAHFKDSDFLIINEDFDQACLDLKSIIISFRLKTGHQEKKYSSLLENII